MIKKPFINNQIRAEKVRLIDETGKQLGIVNLLEALRLARERNLDLIQVTEKVEPPVCKIMDHGKYLYSLQKKEKGAKKNPEMKILRLSFNISPHDLETRALQAEKFLKKGDSVKVAIILRGREKGLSEVAKEKMRSFVEVLKNKIPIKTEGEIKREPRGFTITITGSH